MPVTLVNRLACVVFVCVRINIPDRPPFEQYNGSHTKPLTAFPVLVKL